MYVVSVVKLAFLLLVQCAISICYLHPNSDEFIAFINSKQVLWRAGRNFHEKTPISYFKKLAGTFINHNHSLPEMKYDPEDLTGLPKKFDGRRYWNNCPTLKNIRDQGSCGSCWAVASAAAMTDRICIKSQSRNNFYFSDDDLLSCCDSCGVAGSGCKGGYLQEAWQYYKSSGVVSGGSYNSEQGCKPYEIPPCEHTVDGLRAPCGSNIVTPKCSKKCNNNYKINYDTDKHKSSYVYSVNGDAKQIMREIYRNGPVSTAFEMYEDFLHYQNGIYVHTAGNSLGYHSVKLIGWGNLNKTPYWLAANTWNTDWGHGGFFKIKRGDNHCEIEKNVFAGDPIIENQRLPINIDLSGDQ